MGPRPQCYIQSHKVIGPLVSEKTIFEGFYHIWAGRPSWSCDPHPVNKLSFPRPMEAPHEIWLWLAQRFWRRRSLKIVDGQRTDDGACLYYKLTNKPKGSGELNMKDFLFKDRADKSDNTPLHSGRLICDLTGHSTSNPQFRDHLY